MEFKVVGHPIGRIEGPEKVAGQTLYTADVQLPGLIWASACAVLSPMGDW